MNPPYQLRGYLVKPLSIANIRNFSEGAREVLQLPDRGIQADLFLEGLFHFGITVDVIEEREMPGYPFHSEAYCIPEAATIYLTDETYRKACQNDPRSIFTIFHELGHLLLGHSRTMHRGQKTNNTKPYCDSEWQADQFAAEMIMPFKTIVLNNLFDPEKIQQRFGVSSRAAQKRYNQLLKPTKK